MFGDIDLRNLVLQGLENDGIFDQIRAQLRSSVFKIIEREESSVKDKAGFRWQNPISQAIHAHTDGSCALELIYEFLEFFQMDYTLSVFKNEVNIKSSPNRQELAKKVGLPRPDDTRAVLMNLISANAHHDTSSSVNIGKNDLKSTAGSLTTNSKVSVSTTSNFQPSTKPSAFEPQKTEIKPLSQTLIPQKDDKQKDSLSLLTSSLPKVSGGKLAPLSATSNESGFNTKQNPPTTQKTNNPTTINKPTNEPTKLQQPLKLNIPPKQPQKNSGFDYSSKNEDDYTDEVFEEIEESQEDFFKGNKDKDKKGFGASSESLVAASQSQGFDISVDSLALEEYDHVEDAENV